MRLFPLSCSFRKLKVLSEKPIEFTEVDLSPGDPNTTRPGVWKDTTALLA